MKILHIDLSKTFAPLEADRGIKGIYLVFWINDIPLGKLELLTDQLPISVAEVRLKALEVIMPAVRRMIPAETPAMPPVLHLPLSGQDPDAVIHKLGAMLPGPHRSAGSYRVSVVICTRNRPSELKKCLKSLTNQSYPPHEILVVDNAPDSGDTRRVVEQLPHMLYVPEPRPGLDRARNAGIRNSRGDIIAFTDDDVTVHGDWTARIAESFGDPRVMAVTGLVLPARLDTYAQCFFERYWPLGKGFVKRRYDPHFLADARKTGAPVWEIGAGANMAFRIEAFARFGEFDERLDVGEAGCSGDSEFWYRILAGGGHCLYNPAAVVFHHHRRDLKSLRRQIYGYMKGHVTALLIQHEKFGHTGNLRRLLAVLPRYYFQRLEKCLRGKKTAADRFLVYEIMGYASGLLFYPYCTKAPSYCLVKAMRRSQCNITQNVNAK